MAQSIRTGSLVPLARFTMNAGFPAPIIDGPPISTTLADSLMQRFRADPSSAARASLRWQSNDEPDDGVAHGWQAWLRWWPVDSFFPPRFCEAAMLEEICERLWTLPKDRLRFVSRTRQLVLKLSFHCRDFNF